MDILIHLISQNPYWAFFVQRGPWNEEEKKKLSMVGGD